MDDNTKTAAENKQIASDKHDAYGITLGKDMHVKVYAPFKVYYDELADSISAANDTGSFDILPKHHNFMTLLSAGDIIVRSGQREEKITIQKGIMHVKTDEVIVFLDV